MSLALNKVQRVIQEIRTAQIDMPAQTILALLYIADRDQQGIPVTVADVGHYIGVSSASASRNVAMLAKTSWTGKDGAGLVYAEENPNRKIEKFIKLTPDGKALIKRIEEYIK